MKKRLFSGIQPSGDVHIGNYLGAIKNWIRMIDQYDCIFCIVDYHAITIEYSPQDMQKRILNAAAVNIAAGLDPERCIIFVQSYVPEHTELAWILNTVTPMGHLERMTQFKDKSKQHRENINAGLFTYPVLQAADILLYKGEAVPVGEDQVQHIELAREIARKFNMRYGETFPDPVEILSDAPRIMGLDGKTKMSKSLGNYISLVETPESIWKKLSTAVTDENRKRRTDTGNPDICNLFTLHKYFSQKEQTDRINTVCRSAEIGCVECKKILSENIIKALTPIRLRYEQLINDPGYVIDLLHTGAKKCKDMAEETMSDVKKKMGLM
ncbi:tryptophan--tRNA ligase [Candidatus Brocadia sapporoensis]|uniref:Tryptophan--tRNA ligase n=1 Tax=Candidatus Brocadia sapporoensis TaxID=392547 RepID=A0A1V6LX36_9BACT|nr:tryptophan--tRNA ligase [Candidatus Brocadia sapporoensis]MDG6006134.1 tryptophan--tRNA ligase [Candidatus Brocadia sp.]OQD44700.1 tryptophan--tRNA ligase [Candidatus Brocadia sapporoensis]GJQ23533.1 MAG: tryptophan--tRNA ligase [Candidatus Brocadia sapporoensis]